MSRSTRELCQDAVSELLESPYIEFHIQYDHAVAWMNRAADAGNDDFGQLRTFLASLGESTDAYRGAVGAYMRTMAVTGVHSRALRAAAEYAGLEAPAEDRGPVDRLFDWMQQKFDQPGADGAMARAAGTVRRLAERRH